MYQNARAAAAATTTTRDIKILARMVGKTHKVEEGQKQQHPIGGTAFFLWEIWTTFHLVPLEILD
jgi:hypothetical protein